MGAVSPSQETSICEEGPALSQTTPPLMSYLSSLQLQKSHGVLQRTIPWQKGMHLQCFPSHSLHSAYTPVRTYSARLRFADHRIRHFRSPMQNFWQQSYRLASHLACWATCYSLLSIAPWKLTESVGATQCSMVRGCHPQPLSMAEEILDHYSGM